MTKSKSHFITDSMQISPIWRLRSAGWCSGNTVAFHVENLGSDPVCEFAQRRLSSFKLPDSYSKLLLPYSQWSASKWSGSLLGLQKRRWAPQSISTLGEPCSCILFLNIEAALISKGMSIDSVTFTWSYFDFLTNTNLSEYEDCRYTGTDFAGNNLASVSLDTEEECVKNCLENPYCQGITFVNPNPSQYGSDLHGCHRKSGGWTVNTGTDFQAYMVSVDVACIREKTGNCIFFALAISIW